MDKNYRIHTNIISDTFLNVNMQQDFDFLEVLSLKLRQKDAYRLHSSNYGIIIGRVLANDAFGIPNAKISIFVERDTNDSTDMEALYPYSEVTTKDNEGRRYNILPDYSDDDCYRVVGTFPNKRLMLDDNVQLEVYDKYYKFTTVSNNAGDYMIFGVPTGSTTIHVDIDLSDIGVLSQKPYDFEYKGYNLSMFDSSTQFKDGTNLDNLAQLFSQNKSVFVYPFWGDSDNGIASITRSDIQIQYKFEPTCVFMGSIVSDNEGHSIGHRCAPDVENGMNDQLVGGNGTIEMIRKTSDGLIEEYQIRGNQLIDENGVWCYQIPMNLDYIGTDEYGNIIPTDNPNKGIATRTQVRFRISKNETSDEGFSRHTAKYLVPMNPIFSEDRVTPIISESGSKIENMYSFGSSTPISCFRDLYWNNVYSVKNYIPKTQVAHRAYSKNYCALKGANLATDQNPIPFNKLRIDLPFVYMIVCILFTIVIYIVWFINFFFICTIDNILSIFWKVKNFKLPLIGRVFGWIPVPEPIGCISLSAGISEGNVAYYPGCIICPDGLDNSSCPDDMEGNCEKSTDVSELIDKIQRNLALEYKIIKLDLYQDWINGCLYMPLWYWRKKKKSTFLFGLFGSGARNEYCSDKSLYSRLRSYVTCSIEYDDNSLTPHDLNEDEERWHKNRRTLIRYRRGLIKEVENKDGLKLYYYVATQATTENDNPDLEMEKRGPNFKAIRLFATDIILLGNLDANNLYGIPQFFKCLPSTTSNIPPIATIEENVNPDEKEVDYDKETTSSAEDSGTTITTGMDWNHDGDETTPMYKNGLFMDLACTYAGTRAKSCINVERISELGVSVDMTHSVAYHGGDKIRYGMIDADGFISKYELDDTENRAMFATLNHIGFIPQEYQDLNNSYETQVRDKNTNYLVPKFKYIYPVDFDGRLEIPMRNYANGFEQATYDEKDESYITFRMGAEKGNKNNNSEGRIRHFYYGGSGNRLEMPLYNNSYYFYFGIKKGSTAIDKFNEMFNAPCISTTTAPFSVTINKQGRSFCPSAYSGTCNETTHTYNSGDTMNNAWGYIHVTSDDIRVPYSYELVDSRGTVVIAEDGIKDESFVIGGRLVDGNILLNCNGEVRKQKEPYNVVEEHGLTNQKYRITLTDSDGRKVTERIELETPSINVECQAYRLGTKFYNSGSTRIDYICNKKNGFYGRIEIHSFSVDGYRCSIDNVSGDPNNKNSVTISGHSVDIGNVTAKLDILSYDSENSVDDCMCDRDNDIASAQKPLDDEMVESHIRFITGETENILVFFVYQPNRYIIRITQICAGELSTNSSSEIVTIQNGEPFLTFLNEMPTKFMLGTDNDNSEAAISNKSYFYSSEAVTSTTNSRIIGWYGTHQEDTYHFPNTTHDAVLIWRDYIKNIGDINKPDAKRKIIKYKFDKMFSLSKGVYVTTDSSLRFMFTSQGGASPILYRSVIPEYKSAVETVDNYVLSDYFSSTCLAKFPNIVGNNYRGANNDGANFNPQYKNSNLVGNYFAAFTRDASYINNTTIDGKNINIQRSPSFASISPYSNNTLKRKGKDDKGVLTKFERAYNKMDTQQELDNDISRVTLPYLRALYVDRRLDFDFVILGPVIGINMNMYPKKDADKEIIWKSGRISGFTYNGIEMAYDENYNIISANTSDDETSASMNNLLEYTYEYNGDIAITHYNSGSTDSRWCTWNRGYDAEIDIDGKPYIKQFYESSINNEDISNFYWSNFNKNRLSVYTNNDDINNTIKPFYVYRYPSLRNELYNGDFNRISVSNGNYPTKRFIDIGNLPNVSSYDYGIVGCSYNTKTHIENDGTVVAEARNGEGIDVSLEWGSPITVVKPNDSSEDYSNIRYVATDVSSTATTGYVMFIAGAVSLSFHYNEFTCDGFNAYTKVPKLIKVLPYTNNIDGIGFYKTVNPNEEFGGTYGDNHSLDKAIGEVQIGTFDKNDGSTNVWNIITSLFSGNGKVILPPNVEIDDEGYFVKDGERLTSDSKDFTSITFYKDNLFLKHISVFSVLVDRVLVSDEDDNLTKQLRVIETSELFDARHLLMKIVVKDETNGRTHHGTYVTLSQPSNTTYDIDIDIDIPTSGSGEDSGNDTIHETVNGYDSTRLFSQTLTFEMRFDTSDDTDVDSRQNASFANYSMMSYTFKFKDRNDNVFTITPSEVFSFTDGNYMYLRFILKLPTNMGVFMDSQWSGPRLEDRIVCTMFARTNNGFVYKLSNFRIEFNCAYGDLLPGETGKGQEYQNGKSCSGSDVQAMKDSMIENVKYYSNMRIFIED